MIENRYTIEYVTAENDQKQPSKFRFLVYVLLLLLIISAVGAVASNLGFNRISNSTSELFNQIKTLAFDRKTTEDKNNIVQKKTETSNSIEVKNSSTALPEDVVIQKFVEPVKTKETAILLEKPEIKIADKDITAIVSKTKKEAQEKIDRLALKNKEYLEATKNQLATNSKLNNDINDLTKQLMDEMNRNKELEKKLAKQEADKNALTTLLNNALSNATKEEKTYISALEEIDKEDVSIIVDNNKTVKKETENDEKIAKKVVAQKLTKNTEKIANDYNNSVSLSTNAQVDAIIAAMQGINTPAPRKKVVDVSLHVKLQNQINELIENNDSKTSVSYTKALDKESKERKNEVRSIVVKKGETLWSIALRAYGKGIYYKKIIKANPQLSDKKQNTLIEGQVLRVPI